MQSTYVINVGDGIDRIEDKQGLNKVILDGNELNFFYSNSLSTYITNQDGTLTAEWQGTDLVVTDVPNGTKVILNEDFQWGDFGINLLTVPNNPTTTNTILGDQNPGNLNDNLNGTSANDSILGGAGNDTFNYTLPLLGGVDWYKGGAGDDLVQLASDAGSIAEGNAGSDYITANSADSKLFGDNYGEMSDLIAAGETAAGVNARGDLIRGWTGNDYIYGADANDALFGGNGKDLIVGGGGDDAIYGDDYFDVAGSGGGTYFWDDWSFTLENGGVTMTNIQYHKNTAGDDDVIYAGTGNDYVAAGYGDDEVYGGAGNDIVYGESGNDFIEGGAGDDTLSGDDSTVNLPIGLHGDDYIDGGDGNDVIYGNGGNDELFAGDGTDTLYGNEGDDYLDGEAGADSLNGGTGHDVYEYTIGDGNDQIVDADKDGELVVHMSETNMKRRELGDFYKSGSTEWKHQNNRNIKIAGNMFIVISNAERYL